MSRRAGMATAILVLWMAGLATLVHREFFRADAEKLAAGGLLIEPGSQFYAVSQGEDQIGFASSRIDTSLSGITITDYLAADLEADNQVHRASARLVAHLSRGFVLESFRFELGPEVGPLRATGVVSDDTLFTLTIAMGNEAPDVQRIRLQRPLLLPTLVPMALALTRKPRVGRRYTFSVFDPMAMAPGDVSVEVKAESLFVLSDSAKLDSASGRWVAAHEDTVRAWRIEQQGGALGGWVDDKGRMVEASQLANLRLTRAAYEIAFKNWQASAAHRRVGSGKKRDITEATAIAASVPIRRHRQLARLRVRLRASDLTGFELSGGRQSVRGDTLVVRREDGIAQRAHYLLPSSDSAHAPELRAEPLLQVDDSEIRSLADRIAAGSRNPRVVAQRINRWVHDSLDKKITFAIPNALHILRSRRGDCNEHTQLYIALARAAGLPARGAAGLAYVGGKFYYHAWPEVYLGDWVAVDPTFGQFPADAAHLRFVTGGFSRQAELLRLIGKLQIDVLSAN